MPHYSVGGIRQRGYYCILSPDSSVIPHSQLLISQIYEIFSKCKIPSIENPHMIKYAYLLSKIRCVLCWILPTNYIELSPNQLKLNLFSLPIVLFPPSCILPSHTHTSFDYLIFSLNCQITINYIFWGRGSEEEQNICLILPIVQVH